MFRPAMKGAGDQSRRGILGLAARRLCCRRCRRPLRVGPSDRSRSQGAGQAEEHRDLRQSSLIDKRHMAQLRVNDEIARRALEMYFKTLDPMKLYFYQSDIDKFAPESTQDRRLRQRRATSPWPRRSSISSSSASPSGPPSPSSWSTRSTTSPSTRRWSATPKRSAWFKTKEEADERWRKRVKYDILLQSTDEKPRPTKRSSVSTSATGASTSRWDQTSNDELLEMFLTAVTMSFDPHSSYMSPENLENFAIQMRLELDGIGASLESKYGETVVRHIVPGGAADKDGRLKVDDVITGVAQGADGEVIDITDMKLNDVVMKIRGKPGTVVRLEVKKAGGAELKNYDITRARIELKDSEARSAVLERGPQGRSSAKPKRPRRRSPPTGSTAQEPTGEVIEQKQPDGTVFRLGVINLPSFYMDMEGRRSGREDYKSAVRDVRKLLEELKAKKVDMVVMDLRFNGGGSLPESVEMTGLFIDQGPVVQVKGPDGRVIPHTDDKPGAVWEGPLMVRDQQVQRQRQRDFRRRDPRLRPRHRRRRQGDARQGNGPGTRRTRPRTSTSSIRRTTAP